jgi:hypothetical protein
MHVVEVDVINRARLAVCHHNGPADQLLLGSMQFGEDIHGALVAGARPAHARENSADGSGVVAEIGNTAVLRFWRAVGYSSRNPLVP